MSNEKNKGKRKSLERIVLLVLSSVGVTLLAFNGGWRALAQEGNWTKPIVVSAPPGVSWFPDLTVDELGSVHTVWCQSIPLEKDNLRERVHYARRDGDSWSEPNDIIPPSPDIERNAITRDLAGSIHLLFGGSAYSAGALYHQRAPLSESWSATAWSTPHRINQGISYMGDIVVDSRGVIHVIYDDTLHYINESELNLADIFYRRSTDGGRIWSTPIRLYLEPLVGSAMPYMAVDNNDVIHVTWDEGWDRLSGERSDVYYSVYISSSDGGETWTSPMIIDYPDETVVQLTVGSNGQGGIMLVWRSRTRDEIFYQWSPDGGRSWEEPSPIPQVFSRPLTTPFDTYDMATDSAGHIHLLLVGRESQENAALLGVYHLVWDGDRWSTPSADPSASSGQASGQAAERIFAADELYPEYPRIVVHEGNQLHAAWFTREGNVWDPEANKEVWYSRGQAPAPHQAVTPLPTPTTEPPTVTPSPFPTITPYPTVSLNNTGLPDGLDTESDDLLRLVFALSPIVVVILVVMAVRWLGNRVTR